MKKHHVKALAAAFAVANGHDDPDAYADKVAAAYTPPDPEQTAPEQPPVDDEHVAHGASLFSDPSKVKPGDDSISGGSATSADLKKSVAAARKARTDEGEDE